MTSKKMVENAAFGLAMACLLITTAIIAKQKFFTPASIATMVREPIAADNWENLIHAGQRVGKTDAALTILVFSDFECPACARFANHALQPIRRTYPNEVAFVFRHWPLPFHRFAYPAARAAECAAVQGRFEAYHDLLFQKQDSLGLKSFTQFANESGVPDIPAFETCNSAVGRLPRVDADANAAQEIGGTGTPTIVVNGLRLPFPLDSAGLDKLVRETLREIPRT